MRRVRLAVLASISVLAASPALAQAPQVEKNVSMAMALAIIQGTIEQCTKDGYKVSVVIVDKAGNVAASVRGDGTNPHTMEFGAAEGLHLAHPRPDLAGVHEADSPIPPTPI